MNQLLRRKISEIMNSKYVLSLSEMTVRRTNEPLVHDSYMNLRKVIAKHDKIMKKKFKRADNDASHKEIWSSGIKNKTFLQKYSSAMHSIAFYWKGESSAGRDWIHCNIKEYYNGNMLDILDKERKCVSDDYSYSEEFSETRKNSDLRLIISTDPIKVLDVGSCYNPFASFKDLDVTAIDLCPSGSGVLKCDFIDLIVRTSENESKYRFISKFLQSLRYYRDRLIYNSISELDRESYDVIIFSSFIQCIPSPQLRFECFQKAYNLLKPNGILCLGMHDHVKTGNTGLVFNLLRTSLGHIGFHRIKFHMNKSFYGMVFRKGLSSIYQRDKASQSLVGKKAKNAEIRYHKVNYDAVPNSVFLKGDFPYPSNRNNKRRHRNKTKKASIP